MIAAGVLIGWCPVVAQSQRNEQKIDPAALGDAPVVPQMLVDSDGTLHFGPRSAEPSYYDPRTVAASKVIPMHPGAMKYYRERGYVK